MRSGKHEWESCTFQKRVELPFLNSLPALFMPRLPVPFKREGWHENVLSKALYHGWGTVYNLDGHAKFSSSDRGIG